MGAKSGKPKGSDNCLEYESNPKHKEPWQPGRRGSLCPPETRGIAAQLLRESELAGTRRYAVYEAKAYCAMQHEDDVWHGYPIAWEEVPRSIIDKWINAGRIKKSDVRKSKSKRQHR